MIWLNLLTKTQEKKRQNLTATVDLELLAKPSVSIASKYLEATKATDQMVQTKHHTSCPIWAEKMQKLAKCLQKSDYQKVATWNWGLRRRAQPKAPISNTIPLTPAEKPRVFKRATHMCVPRVVTPCKASGGLSLSISNGFMKRICTRLLIMLM